MTKFSKLGIAMGVATIIGAFAPSASAANSSVEMTIRNYGDLSMFYQAMLNTGVVNELNEQTHYTIFAPVDSSFQTLTPQSYPCFYAVQCRPQIAELLRNHIIVGEHNLDNLVTYGSGIQTAGNRPIYVTEPYVGQYRADDHAVLSRTEINGNVIYRIDGFGATPQEMAQFRSNTPAIIPASVGAPPITQRTTVQKTYYTPLPHTAYPAGAMISPSEDTGNVSETTTIIQRDEVEPGY